MFFLVHLHYFYAPTSEREGGDGARRGPWCRDNRRMKSKIRIRNKMKLRIKGGLREPDPDLYTNMLRYAPTPDGWAG